MVNAIILVAGLAALAVVINAKSIHVDELKIKPKCPTGKTNALFLVSVFGYVINPTFTERGEILTRGEGFKQQDVTKEAIAGGCKDVRVELWEEDEWADEMACGENEKETVEEKKLGHEITITGANGFFHLAGVSQDCGGDVEPFIKIIYKSPADGVAANALLDKEPSSCGKWGEDIDSKDITAGRIRIAVPDKPYGFNNLAVPGTDADFKKAIEKLTDLTQADDAALLMPKRGFYFGRVNLQLVEYYHEAHDFEDGEFNMVHLASRVVKTCEHKGAELLGWQANGESALWWMNEILTKAYSKATKAATPKTLPTGIKKTGVESKEPK